MPGRNLHLTAKALRQPWRCDDIQQRHYHYRQYSAIGKIAFASNRDGCAQIYLMNTDGTGQSCLSNGAANDESPKWSPDNSRIVFQSDRDFQSNTDNPIYGSDIYVMNWDGSRDSSYFCSV